MWSIPADGSLFSPKPGMCRHSKACMEQEAAFIVLAAGLKPDSPLWHADASVLSVTDFRPALCSTKTGSQSKIIADVDMLVAPVRASSSLVTLVASRSVPP